MINDLIIIYYSIWTNKKFQSLKIFKIKKFGNRERSSNANMKIKRSSKMFKSKHMKIGK